MKCVGGLKGAVLAAVIAVVGVAAGAGAQFHVAASAPARHSIAGEAMPPIPLANFAQSAN